MKFIHIADVHLGASPDCGSAYSKNRTQEIWDSFARVIEVCGEEAADVLFIAGDLFHRQPLLRELKEVHFLFSKIPHTHIIMIAGNHDYLKKDSYYRTFQWEAHVHMILEEELSCVELEELGLAVYGCSYGQKENVRRLYDKAFPEKRQPFEVLLAHGGDEKHIPFVKSDILSLGYDYVALGHIHKPQYLQESDAAYCGALEPVDKNDTGAHGYIVGEITEEGCESRFVASAVREYIHLNVEVTHRMTGYELRERLKEQIEKRGRQHIYKVVLVGFRDPDVLFDVDGMDAFGNIVELTDETKPAYHFEKIYEQNEDNLLGKFIKSLIDNEKDSVEYEALCEGVQALMETRRG